MFLMYFLLLVPVNFCCLSGPLAIDPSNMDINSLMQYGYMELRLMIEWARKVPGIYKFVI